MALPAGITTCQVTAGTVFDFGGGTDYSTEIIATPLTNLTWQATGAHIIGPKATISNKAEPGVQAVIDLPHVDQPGFLYNGAPYTMWAYKIEIVWYKGSARIDAKTIRALQPVQGQTLIDLDPLADESPALPVNGLVPYVTSVNGETGEVTVTGGTGGSVGVTVTDTPTAPAEGASASYFVTSAVTWPAGLQWSTDPDGGIAPTITGTALVSMFSAGGVTRAVLGATFPALPDTVAPVAGTLASSSITETGWTLTVTGASDAGGLAAAPYSFSTDAGTSWSAYQAGATYAVTGKTAGTGYTCQHRVIDAAGNVTVGASISVTTVAPDTTAPLWSATFTMGAPTQTAVVATASALATDNVGVTGYDVSYNGGTTWTAITPSGMNFTLTGTAGTTYSTTQLRARDAAGNTSTPLAVPPYTMAASTDTTAPTAGTLASSAITSSGFTLTVSGASDETGLHATPYAFSTDNGTTWSAYQASASYTASGLTASTAYTCLHRVRDAAGNVSTGASIQVTTGAPATGLTAAYVSTGQDSADLASYTFAAQDIGAADPTRAVIVAVYWRVGWTAAPTVTIGGTAATRDAQLVSTEPQGVAIYRANVPTGTTADVVVTGVSGAAQRCAITVHTLTGATAALDTSASGLGSGTAMTATATADVTLIAASIAYPDSAAPAWAGGVAQDLFLQVDPTGLTTLRASVASGTAPAGALSVSATWPSATTVVQSAVAAYRGA